MLSIRRKFFTVFLASIIVFVVDICLYLSSGTTVGMLAYSGKKIYSSPCRSVHCPIYLPERTGAYRAEGYGGQTDTILIVSPVFSESEVLAFLENLCCLAYPKNLISLAILEGHDVNQSIYPPELLSKDLEHIFHRVTVVSLEDLMHRWDEAQPQDSFEKGELFSKGTQFMDVLKIKEDWLLWFDLNVVEVPSDLIQKLLGSEKEVVVPTCLVRQELNSTYKSPPYRGNFETDSSIFWERRQKIEDYHRQKEVDRTLYLQEILEKSFNNTNTTVAPYVRPDNPTMETPLDVVHSSGDCIALVKAEFYRKDLILPSMIEKFLNLNDTYGLALMAETMGTSLYGMPTLKVYHT